MKYIIMQVVSFTGYVVVIAFTAATTTAVDDVNDDAGRCAVL